MKSMVDPKPDASEALIEAFTTLLVRDGVAGVSANAFGDDVDPRCRDNFVIDAPEDSLDEATQRTLEFCTEQVRLGDQARERCASLAPEQLSAFSISSQIRDAYPAANERELQEHACFPRMIERLQAQGKE